MLITTGEDIGAAANAMDIQSALLLGAIQESQRQFNRTSADPFVSDFDRLSKTKQNKFLVGGLLGVDYQAARNQTPTFSDVLRSSSLETQRASVSGIRGIGGRADAAIAQAQARRQIEDNLKIAFPAERRRELDIKDANTNRLRWGGKLREGMSVWDEGAVVGGYSSAKEFSRAGKRKQSEEFRQAQIFADYFTGIGRVSSYTGMSDLRGQLGGIKQRADTIKTALSSAGLSYKTFNARTGLPYRASAWQRYNFNKEWNAVRSFNDNQYAKAKQINILQQDFGVTGFTGSALTLPSLQDEVARQDALIKSIGLDRTEAFQIVDTAGRGREEIDDRIRFKDRMSSMSTGVSVL